MQITQNGYIDQGYCNVTGVLLAGGRSRRMGCDKALLEYKGEAFSSRALNVLKTYFTEVLIAGDRPDLATPETPCWVDHYPGSSLGGIHTGLRAAQTDWICVIPCDMPYPDGRIIEGLLGLREGAEAVVPRTEEGYEPVFALYHKNCLPRIEALLRRDHHRIYDLYQRIKVRYLEPSDLPPDWRQSLLNINTPEQLNYLRENSP